MTNGEDLAQPLSHETILQIESGFWYSYGLGLTKREYFAAMAMQGLLARFPNRAGLEPDLGVNESKRIAAESVIMSDELIKALNDKP